MNLFQVCSQIKRNMVLEGTLMIGYQPMANKGWVNFFRIIISNPTIDNEDLDFVIKEIDRLGKQL